jgi:hypothetical protein
MSEQNDSGWERVYSNKQRATLRLSVPGGWIYLILPKDDAGSTIEEHGRTVFVPTPRGEVDVPAYEAG